jgi:hypothetical protein
MSNLSEDKHNFDEASTYLLDTMPGFLYSFYAKLIKEGFNPIQALELTKEQLKVLGGGTDAT